MNIQSTIENFKTIRKQTEKLVEPLKTEDFVVQAMPDVSPPKWHLAHTTWFFERFILIRVDSSYEWFHPTFDHLFNSYYVRVDDPLADGKKNSFTQKHVQWLAYNTIHFARMLKSTPIPSQGNLLKG